MNKSNKLINSRVEKMPDSNYYCDICDAGFKKKSECFEHIKNKHTAKEIETGIGEVDIEEDSEVD